MGIQVSGVVTDMPGLKKSLNEHRIESAKTADQLLNVSDGFKGAKNAAGERLGQDDPRPPYVYAEYPRMLFHAREGEIIVHDDDQLQAAEAKGYRKTPYPVVKVTAANPDVEKANLQRELKEKDGQIASLASDLDDLKKQFAELMTIARGGGKTAKAQ